MEGPAVARTSAIALSAPLPLCKMKQFINSCITRYIILVKYKHTDSQKHAVDSSLLLDLKTVNQYDFKDQTDKCNCSLTHAQEVTQNHKNDNDHYNNYCSVHDNSYHLGFSLIATRRLLNSRRLSYSLWRVHRTICWSLAGLSFGYCWGCCSRSVCRDGIRWGRFFSP